MPELVDRLGRGAALPESFVGAAQAREGEHGDPASGIPFAEDEVELRNVEVDLRDSDQPLPLRLAGPRERVEKNRRPVLAALPVVRRGRKRQAGRQHDFDAEGGLERLPKRGDLLGPDLADRRQGNPPGSVTRSACREGDRCRLDEEENDDPAHVSEKPPWRVGDSRRLSPCSVVFRCFGSVDLARLGARRLRESGSG